MNRIFTLLCLLASGTVSAQMSCNTVGAQTYCNGPTGTVTCSDVGQFRYCNGPNGTVTCNQVGAFTYCNGPGLQQQAQPQQQPQLNGFRQGFQIATSPSDAFARGWAQGQQMKQDRQRANLERLAAVYFAGKVYPDGRAKFLSDVAKNGGDAAWYRNDMEQRDAAQSAAYTPPPPPDPPRPAPGELFSYFPDAPHQVTQEQSSTASTEKDAEIARLRTQVEAMKAELTRAKPTVVEAPVSSRLVRFTGRQERLSASKLRCEYDLGSRTIWHESFGSCPSAINYP